MRLFDNKSKDTVDFDLSTKPGDVTVFGVESMFFRHDATQEIRVKYWLSDENIGHLGDVIARALYEHPEQMQIGGFQSGGSCTFAFSMHGGRDEASISIMHEGLTIISVLVDLSKLEGCVRRLRNRLEVRKGNNNDKS